MSNRFTKIHTGRARSTFAGSSARGDSFFDIFQDPRARTICVMVGERDAAGVSNVVGVEIDEREFQDAWVEFWNASDLGRSIQMKAKLPWKVRLIRYLRHLIDTLNKRRS